MLQRIQTIFLLLASFSGMSMFALPLGKIQVNEKIFDLTPMGVLHWDHSSVALVPMLTTAIFLLLFCVCVLAAVVLFKSRRRQMFLCRVALLLITAFMVSFFYYMDEAACLHEDLKDGTLSYSFMVIMGPVSLVLTILALRAINKDEKLVRSLDRIR